MSFLKGGKLVTKKAKFVWKVDRVTSQPKGSCKCEAYRYSIERHSISPYTDDKSLVFKTPVPVYTGLRAQEKSRTRYANSPSW